MPSANMHWFIDVSSVLCFIHMTLKSSKTSLEGAKYPLQKAQMPEEVQEYQWPNESP